MNAPKCEWKDREADHMHIGRWSYRCSILVGEFLLGLLFIGLPSQVVAQGCAMCRTALGGPDDPLSQAFNTSILFLMSMPFVLTGTVIAWFLYMHYRVAGGSRELSALQTGREDQP